MCRYLEHFPVREAPLIKYQVSTVIPQSELRLVVAGLEGRAGVPTVKNRASILRFLTHSTSPILTDPSDRRIRTRFVRLDI